MEQELKIETWYNKPYHQIHRRNKLLNHKQKLILAYSIVGATIFIVGIVTNELIKLFS